MIKTLKILILFTGNFICINLYAQKIFLKIEPSIKYSIDYKKNFKDTLSAKNEVKNVILKLQMQGFLLSSVDSFLYQNDSLYAFIDLGKKYKWNKLYLAKESYTDFKNIGINEKSLANEYVLHSKINKLAKKIITYSENNGFPFADVQFDSLIIQDNLVSARLNYNKGRVVVFDSIIISGSNKLKYSYLQSYIGINKQALFSQKKVLEVPKYLRQLSYIRLKNEPELYFERNRAHLLLNFEERKSSQFDFILGVLPNENNGNLLITGEASLRLRNLFNAGKSLNVEWKKFMQSSQLFDIDYTHTRIFKSALDVGLSFKSLKQDTLFSQFERGISFGALLSSKLRLTFFLENKSTRLDPKTSTSELYLSSTTLPTLSDLTINKYGLVIDWNNTDDFFYPKKGFIFSAKTSVGNKNILVNDAFNQIVYKDIKLKTIQFDYIISSSKYFKVSTKSTFLLKLKVAQVYNDNLFQNDLMRIGGLQSIRGFNEQFFFSSFYTISTAEYRFFTDETSYLFAFYDQSYIKNIVLRTIGEDFPSGVGVGISFTTPGGIFNFAYSIGRSKNQPFSLNYSKLHFGFISRF